MHQKHTKLLINNQNQHTIHLFYNQVSTIKFTIFTCFFFRENTNNYTNKVTSASCAVGKNDAAPTQSATSGTKSSIFQPNKSTVI